MEYLVFLGMAISLVGVISYIKDMLQGKAKPNRVSWLMWSIAPLIATFAALSTGVTLAVIPVFMSGFGPLLVFTVSLFKKDAYWKLTKFDFFCGALSLLALILWYITKNPIIAIVFSILSDLLAAVPTIKKAWNHPESESSMAFIAGILSAATSFFAIKELGFTSLAFPIYLILVNICIIYSIEKNNLFKSNK